MSDYEYKSQCKKCGLPYGAKTPDITFNLGIRTSNVITCGQINSYWGCKINEHLWYLYKGNYNALETFDSLNKKGTYVYYDESVRPEFTHRQFVDVLYPRDIEDDEETKIFSLSLKPGEFE